METTKEEMMQFLRELQDLQMWIYDSLHEMALDIYFNVCKNSFAIYCHFNLFLDIRMNKSVHIHSQISYEENRKQLNYFIEYVKKLSKYGYKKSETNQTPVGKARV